MMIYLLYAYLAAGVVVWLALLMENRRSGSARLSKPSAFMDALHPELESGGRDLQLSLNGCSRHRTPAGKQALVAVQPRYLTHACPSLFY